MSKSIPPKDEDIDKIFEKAAKMKEDLEAKLNKLDEEMGVTPEEMKKTMLDPKNFTPEEWKEIQNERKAMVEELGPLLTPEEKKELLKVEELEVEKKKKGKPASSRQKWIQM